MRTLTPDDFLPTAPQIKGWRDRRAPLKSNALETLHVEYSRMGFATAPVKAQKDTLAIRIVWVYPSVRETLPIIYYESVGLVNVPISEKAANWTFRLQEYSRYAAVFQKFFSPRVTEDPRSMFSTIGTSEIEIALRSRESGGHPRTMQNRRRMRIVAELPELWHAPHRIVHLLRDCGLFSERASIVLQVQAVKEIIRKCQAKTGGNS